MDENTEMFDELEAGLDDVVFNGDNLSEALGDDSDFNTIPDSIPEHVLRRT